MARTEQVTALQTEISTSEVGKRIYTLRGFQVMLDRDLAEIYGFFGSSHLIVGVYQKIP